MIAVTGSITGRYDGSNRHGSGSSRWLPTYTFSGKNGKHYVLKI
jgi:hypothetical protein